MMMKCSKWARRRSAWSAANSISSLSFLRQTVKVALDAALSVENQVPGAGGGAQIVHGIGNHAAEPAEAVLAADLYATQPSQIVEGGIGNQRLYFGRESVQLNRRKDAVDRSGPVWRIARCHPRGKGSGNQRSG